MPLGDESSVKNENEPLRAPIKFGRYAFVKGSNLSNPHRLKFPRTCESSIEAATNLYSLQDQLR